MKKIHYGKWSGDDAEAFADELSLEQLMQALSGMLLMSEMGDASLRDLLDALEQLLMEAATAPEDDSGPLDERQREWLRQASEEQVHAALQRLLQRLQEEGYIVPAETAVAGQEPFEAQSQTSHAQHPGHFGGQERVRFEITDKALDFLGFKALKQLLGSLGKASFGRHDTRELATGIDVSGSSRQYEFGDTLNLDISATIGNALRREGLNLPIGLDYSDLMVHQAEYQSSCATVVMLDCSHSMVLYGEDRFTPAKRVAMALAHLIRTQYPGDSLQLVLFHDSAEEVSLSQLARVQVGPHYTNTREGLRLAQRLLARQRKDMKQIVMITDGKPSALTMEDGRIYKNAFGLDPLVIEKTLEEVAQCRRSGIMINTFMLASDHGLVQFVQKVTAMCRGKAYFTTPYTLGQYLLQDYLGKKTQRIH